MIHVSIDKTKVSLWIQCPYNIFNYEEKRGLRSNKTFFIFNVLCDSLRGFQLSTKITILFWTSMAYLITFYKDKTARIFFYPSFVYSCLYLNLDALVIYILIFDINKSSNVHIQFISSWFNGPRRQEKWLSWCSTKGHPKLVLTGNYKMHIIRIVIK